MMNNKLTQYGADDEVYRQAEGYPELRAARVISQYKNLYRIVMNNGEYLAEVSGKFRYNSIKMAEYPTVGDFVMVGTPENKESRVLIYHVLPRKSFFARRAVGIADELQAVAANVDVVFVCMSLNHNYKLNRLERYLSVAWNSGAVPVIVLTKADLVDEPAKFLAEAANMAVGTEIILATQEDGSIREKLLEYIKTGCTAVFIGSSGVGKSTLINILLNEAKMEVSAIRKADSRGRHTTTRRELALLANGGIVIDTPGMRELGADMADLTMTFEDIEQLAAKCRFNDCMHTNEPGCAVIKAIKDGRLDERRYNSYQKLKREIKYEGLSGKALETVKLSEMFQEAGGMKKIRKYNRLNDKRKRN